MEPFPVPLMVDKVGDEEAFLPVISVAVLHAGPAGIEEDLAFFPTRQDQRFGLGSGFFQAKEIELAMEEAGD